MNREHSIDDRRDALDPEQAAKDSALPWLRTALDPSEIGRLIAPLVARAEGQSGAARLREARLVRHKPGRRCVVYYEFDIESRRQPPIVVYGKIRARGADMRTQSLLSLLRKAGLRHDDASRVAVPEPIGAVPELHMTLQRGAAGQLVSEALGEPGGARVMEQVAEALHALHRSGIVARRTHDLGDELAILEERLGAAAAMAPRWGERIESVREACRGLAPRMDPAMNCGIHRDFYPDQVLVDGARLSLLDLDLFAIGDPALDVGNFSAHLTEMALRVHGDPEAFADLERGFEERYAALSPEVSRASVRGYRILTLARHIHLSMTIPGRSDVTEDLLAFCERQLDPGVARCGSEVHANSQ